MEAIIKCVEKAFHFVSIVQKACDDRRQYLEQSFRRNYDNLYEEWKKTQKGTETPEAFSGSKSEHTESTYALEIEELLLADQLLQKARRIREKLKVPFTPEECIPSETKNVNQQLCTKTEIEDLVQSDKLMMKQDMQNKGRYGANSDNVRKYSKHSLADQPRKSTLVDKKKVSKCVKNVSTSKMSNCKNPQIKHNAKIPYQKLKIKSTNAASVSAISKRDLYQYKNMQIEKEPVSFKSKNLGLKTSDKKLTVKELIHNIEVCTLKTSGSDKEVGFEDIVANKGASVKLKSPDVLEGSKMCKATCKDTSVITHEMQLGYDACAKKDSSRRTFHNMISDMLKEQRNIRPNSSCIWYPFLNSQNEARLSAAICCKDNEELKKACTLFHGIQEIMLWIDLISLLGKEILPHLHQLDRNDENTAVIHSYLKSILCEDLTYIPIAIKP